MRESVLEVTTALQAAVMASDLCQKVERDLSGEVSFVKSDRSPVTIADYGSQAIICKLIRDRFPEDTIIAEEDSRELRNPDHTRIFEQVARYVSEEMSESSRSDGQSGEIWRRGTGGGRFLLANPFTLGAWVSREDLGSCGRFDHHRGGRRENYGCLGEATRFFLRDPNGKQ